MKSISAAALLAAVLFAAPVMAQDVGGPPPPPPGPTPETTIAPTEWRAVPAENLLVIDTTKGRILVELAPEVAPLHVERIKLLARRGFYDNVPWHRVIDWFMAQPDDAAERIDNPKSVPRRAGDQQAAVIGPKIERPVQRRLSS